MESAFWGSKCFIRRLLRWFSTRSWTWAGSTPAVKIKKIQMNERPQGTREQSEEELWRIRKPETLVWSCSLLPTHLDEPLCQQIDGLSHSRVVFREKLDDVFWRATCLEIPARKTGFLSSNALYDSCVQTLVALVILSSCFVFCTAGCGGRHI